MKIIKNIFFLTLILVFVTALCSCSKVPVTNNADGEGDGESVTISTFSVKFYDKDGEAVFNEQFVKEGEEFVLPTSVNGKAVSGYYTWEGLSWSADFIPLADFDKPDAKKVTHDLQFKAQYVWTGISR